MVFLTFINMGVLAALGGMIIAARFNSATPKAGYGFELDVIAATFVGGASAYGGVGTVAGTVIGALFFGLLNIGMGVMSDPDRLPVHGQGAGPADRRVLRHPRQEQGR